MLRKRLLGAVAVTAACMKRRTLLIGLSVGRSSKSLLSHTEAETAETMTA